MLYSERINRAAVFPVCVKHLFIRLTMNCIQHTKKEIKKTHQDISVHVRGV